MSLDEDYAPWPNADEAGQFDAAIGGLGTSGWYALGFAKEGGTDVDH